MKLLISAFLLASIAALVVDAVPSQSDVPIIGILVSPLEECIPPPAHITNLGPVNGCIESYYVRWLEMSSARVVPVPWNATDAHLAYLMPRLNGILFPGGGMYDGPVDDAYLNTLGRIVNITFDMNENKKDPMLLWGTCFGFQMMGAVIARNWSVVSGGFSGMYPLMMPLNFTVFQPNSRLFNQKSTPPELLQALQSKPTTLNWHHNGITPNAWANNRYLMSKLRALSTNTEPSGLKQFVSAYEGVTANIYATQFHPERPPYEFRNDAIGHSADAVHISQYMSRFVIARARLNSHKFDTPAHAEALVVEQHPLVYQGLGTESYYIIGDPESRSGLREKW